MKCEVRVDGAWPSIVGSACCDAVIALQQQHIDMLASCIVEMMVKLGNGEVFAAAALGHETITEVKRVDRDAVRSRIVSALEGKMPKNVVVDIGGQEHGETTGKEKDAEDGCGSQGLGRKSAADQR